MQIAAALFVLLPTFLSGTGHCEAAQKVAGIISDSQGDPVADAKVRCWWPGSEVDDFAEAYSDQGGNFSIEMPKRPNADTATPLYLMSHKADFALVYQVVDTTKNEGESIKVELPPSTTVSIRVHDEDDQPIEGAVLTTVGTDAHYSARQSFSPSLLNRFGVDLPASDRHGLIRVAWMPPADFYRVSLEHEQFARETHRKVIAGKEPFAIRMEQGTLMKFQVYCDHDPRAVQDASLDVSLYSTFGPEHLQVSLNESGAGQFRLKVKDNATVSVRHPTLYGTPFHSVNGTDRAGRIHEFQLSKMGKIRGLVINSESGKEAADVEVLVVDLEHHTVIARGKSDDSGAYSIECPTIQCEVVASSSMKFWQSDPTQRWRVHPTTNASTTVPILHVKPKHEHRGIVLGLDEAPAAGVLVGTGSMRQFELTDADGRFSIPHDQLPSGNLAIFAMHLTRPEVGFVRTVDYSPGDDMIIKLKPECTASGVVVGPDEKPAGAVQVELTLRIPHDRNVRPGARPSGRTTVMRRYRVAYTDDKGRYEFIGLVPGLQYGVSVSESRTRRGIFQPTEKNTELPKLVFDPQEKLRFNSSVIQEKLILSDEPPPELQCAKWYNTEPLSLRHLKGKVIVLHFYGTWYGGRESRMLNILHQQFAKDELVVIAVRTARGFVPEAVEKEIADSDVQFPVAIDQEAQSTWAAYGVTKIPTTLLIDRQGQLHGSMRHHQLISLIRSELAANQAKQ